MNNEGTGRCSKVTGVPAYEMDCLYTKLFERKPAWVPHPCLRVWTLRLTTIWTLLTAVSCARVAASTNASFKVEALLKETYDSNLYLQDIKPNPANVAAVKAAGFNPAEPQKASWVTTLTPKVGFDWRPGDLLALSLSYCPEMNVYQSAEWEDYVTHRVALSLDGKVQKTTWALVNTAAYIDGSREGPIFARPGDIPAVGAIPVRDRRAAFVFRNGFKVTQALGEVWFLRPLASSYIHDFKTEQRYIPKPVRSTVYSYENYFDRQEISGGLDLGYRVAANTHLVLGYRYGQQEQFSGPTDPLGQIVDSPFDSVYHRVLTGVEGSLKPWLKINLLIGPDIRQFSDAVPRVFPGFRDDDLLYFLDGCVMVTPTDADCVTLRATRYEQPAFSSPSVYEDIRNELSWRHTLNEHLAATLGFALYIADWQPPTHRNDWIYSPNTSLIYCFNQHFTTEVGYCYEFAESYVSAKVEPYTAGHEYTRHLATISIRYSF